MTGKLLESKDGYTSNEEISIGENLATGTYMVTISSDFEVTTLRLLKNND